MALKNMIKVGDKVTFGRAGEEKVVGTVIKKNPKTARIKVSRKGEFLVTYNLIQKPRKHPGAAHVAKRKATGKKICAVPVGKRARAISKRRAKKNPPKKGAKRLVHSSTGREVKVGEILTNFRGEKWKLHDWREGQGASSGRVFVTDLDEGFERGFYPSVFDLEWKPHMFAMKGGKKNPGGYKKHPPRHKPPMYYESWLKEQTLTELRRLLSVEKELVKRLTRVFKATKTKKAEARVKEHRKRVRAISAELRRRGK